MNLKDKVFQDHIEVVLRNGNKGIVVHEYIRLSGRAYGEKKYNHELKYMDINNEYISEFDIMKAINPFTNEVIYERDEINYDKLVENAVKKLYIPIDNKVILMSEDVIKHLEEPKLNYPTKRDGFVAKYRGVEVAKVEGEGVMRVLYEIL